MNEAWTHGATLALTFGCGLRFTCAKVTAGSSLSSDEQEFIGIYPERYQGMGGGWIGATSDGAPAFDLPVDDEGQAEDIVAAFNYFALEGVV